MKGKYSYIGISLVILVFGIIVIPKIVDRIKNGNVTESTRMNVVQNTDGTTENGELSYITINGKDRKVPEFAFINQDGDTITNKDYRGKVYLVEFFFSRCTNICIPMNSNLVQIANEFAKEPRFGIASFSIDPEHDTPEVLKAYAEDYGVTHPNWNFLTGDREEIYDLANDGFNIIAIENPETPGGFEHNGHFALVDQNGFIRSRLDDFGNAKIYYRGHIPAGAKVADGEEEPEIGILVEDIKKLLKR